MLEHHDLLGSSIQNLNVSVCSGNCNSGVPYVIGSKHKREEDDSLASSRKIGKGSEIAKQSESIEKHGESLLAIAKLAALQQQKDCCHECADSIHSRLILFVMQRGI